MPEDPFAWPGWSRDTGWPLTRTQVAELLGIQPNSVQALIKRPMAVPFPEIGGRAIPTGGIHVTRYWWEKDVRRYAKDRKITITHRVVRGEVLAGTS
jgi:hypothetical protein